MGELRLRNDSTKMELALGIPNYANFRCTLLIAQPRVLFYTLYTFNRNKRYSPSLSLFILLRKQVKSFQLWISDTLQSWM